ETYEISKRYITPCFVNGLEAYDGEINLAFDENLISNDYAVKLCLDYEVRKGKKLVKKELIVALKGELYFVKFIINPKEDDVKPEVILGRSFLRLAKGIVDFGNGVINIYPEPDPFDDDSEKTGKSSDDWDQLLDFNFDDVPKFGEELPSFVCKMGKSNRNKKKAMEYLGLSKSHTSTIKNLLLRVIHKMITYGLCQRTTGYDKIQKNDLWLVSMLEARHQNGYTNVAWLIAKWMKKKRAGTQKDSQIYCGQFITKLARKCRVLTKEVVKSLSVPIYCRDLDKITLRDLIDSDGNLIPEDPQPDVPRVGIPRPPRASMQDLYDRMGRTEIRQGVIERMEYRQSYHWDIYHGVFEHMAGVYSVPLQGAYNPPGYAQPQYEILQSLLVYCVIFISGPRMKKKD
ncbi:hypothetical protein Tco_1266570, partial [Tanacetum coccineum]